MGQVLHGSARTTEAVRRAIQRSEESVRALAGRYGISPTTVQKWRKRASVSDARMGPKAIHSTVLTAEEEAMVVAFRRHTLLPLACPGEGRGLPLCPRGLILSGEQQAVLRHATAARDLGLVIGYAGSGKSAMLGVAREAWEAQGYTVRGAALSGIAAENLEQGSGIVSRTIASLEHQWARGRDRLAAGDVLVVVEAGMIGSRQMERLATAVAEAGAKLVLVGDAQQLQAIEAGAAFRLLTERHGAREISAVRRQHAEWQRDATRELATGRIGEALARHDRAGMVHAADTREAAAGALIECWEDARERSPAQTHTILAHTRADVRMLNEMARDALKQGGQLDAEIVVETARGTRLMAPGERIIFLKNDRALNVKNGTLATIERLDAKRIEARLDDGRSVGFDLK